MPSPATGLSSEQPLGLHSRWLAPELRRWLEAQRVAVNVWIRTRANFDAIIDFDALLKGGPVYSGSESIKAEFNCDYTHPSAAGYKAMGEFIDLFLFRLSRRWAAGR
jgi:lysophospholipase L1-like esterase